VKKEYIFGILFFGGLWGLSEAGLGGLLYNAHIPCSSIILTIIAFGILAISRAYFPQIGTATLIGLCAMLFKFFNSPFFACHFPGIAMVGISFDLFFALLNIKNKAVAGFAAAFANYVAFAVFMTFIIRYAPYWTVSMAKFNGHIIEGFFAAIGCAITTPVMLFAGRLIKAKLETPFIPKLKPAQGFVSLATAGLWVFSLIAYSQTLIINASR
jgi:hypothetical protein